MKNALVILLFVMAVGGASASFYLYQENQRVKSEARVLHDTATEVEKEFNELQQKLVTATAAQISEEMPTIRTSETPDYQVIIEDMEARLRAKDEELEMLRANAAGIGLPDTIRAWMPEDRRDWLSNLQANDPERYQDIMERRERARQTARYEIARRAAHFLFRDESQMSEQESEQHQRMMSLLHDSLILTEQLNAELPSDQRREIGRELRRNMRELSPLLETERDRELFRIGKDLGYNDDQAAQFTLYIRDVIDLTSVQSVFRNSMRAMGGGPWGNPDRSSP
ncbi:MAG TPA: hypothetical protein PJ991_01135 [Kiritimatiellia bacterium]|nr:hypothetical protein [Kiritimatiellia bacterium]